VALQAGIAVCADAVLIPEIPCDLRALAARLQDKVTPRRPYGLVVVAEGAKLVEDAKPQEKPSPLKASLSPLATGDASEHVIRKSGQAAETVATRLQLLVAEETYPLVLGPGSGRRPHRRRPPTGAGLRRGRGARHQGRCVRTMVAFVPPDMRFVPLAEAINKVRTVPTDSEFIQIASSLGIFLGREL